MMRFFLQTTCMKPSEFKILKNFVRPHIKKFPAGRKALSVGHRLAITLRFLASGDSMKSISFAFRIGFSTAHKIIFETCDALWKSLQPDYLPSPTLETWRKVEKKYEERWNFPNCVGTIDGKHFNTLAPKNSKGRFSTALMAIVDANYKFVVVDINSFESNSDGRIWKNSQFGSAYDKGEIDIPPPKTLPGSRKVLPHVFLGDETFQLGKNFMSPYPGKKLDNRRRICNYRLSPARRCTENTFGISVNRWRVLKNELEMKPENADLVVKACVVLHNFLMTQGESSTSAYFPPSYADRLGPNGDIIEGKWREEENVTNIFPTLTGSGSAQSEAIREEFCHYFNNEGAVEWQNKKAALI